MKRLVTLFPVLTVVSSAAIADLQVDILNNNGISSYYSNGSQVRMEDRSDFTFAIVDTLNNSILMLDPNKREAMDLTDMSNPYAASMQVAPPPVASTFQQAGPGPVIAGFETQTYRVMLNGQDCGTVYTSKKALEVSGMRPLIKAMQQFREQALKMKGGFDIPRFNCDDAIDQLFDDARRIGVPMKITNTSGIRESEISRINASATTPAGFYEIPPGYRVVSIQDQINESMRNSFINQGRPGAMPGNMPPTMPGMPDMNQFYQQMQQNGGMPPDALDQIKRMQDMMNQQYRQ